MSKDSVAPEFVETLASYRNELDSLDAELIAVLAKRFAVTAKVGELKAEYAASPSDAAREERQLKRLADLSREQGLPVEVTRTIFETIFALVRDNHRSIALARSSPPPSFQVGS